MSRSAEEQRRVVLDAVTEWWSTGPEIAGRVDSPMRGAWLHSWVNHMLKKLERRGEIELTYGPETGVALWRRPE